MAVCWSGNTNFHKKEKFPYQAATKLATSLWTVKTKYRPIVYVIYDRADGANPALETYLKELTAIGARVESVATDDMACSLKAQLQRMFAFQLDFVGDEDVVVTSDVDTFVMHPRIFEPLKEEKYQVNKITFTFIYSGSLGGNNPLGPSRPS